MAKVLEFPVTVPQQRARLAKSEAKDWQLRRLAWAADCSSAASCNLSNAVMRLLSGETIADDDVVLNGETLADALTGALCIIEARGSAADIAVARAIRVWLETNDQGDDDVA